MECVCLYVGLCGKRQECVGPQEVLALARLPCSDTKSERNLQRAGTTSSSTLAATTRRLVPFESYGRVKRRRVCFGCQETLVAAGLGTADSQDQDAFRTSWGAVVAVVVLDWDALRSYEA